MLSEISKIVTKEKPLDMNSPVFQQPTDRKIFQ
jgi:hypothetical protein